MFPRTTFAVAGTDSQPVIRNVPAEMITALKMQIQTAAVREKQVDLDVATAFAARLGQGSLVMAFLIAQLDLPVQVDLMTQAAVQLFRTQNPLLSSVVERMSRLEEHEREQRESVSRLSADVKAIQITDAAIEQAVAYILADRTANFLQGFQQTKDAPITDRVAVMIRDKVREETAKLARHERDRDGRPMR